MKTRKISVNRRFATDVERRSAVERRDTKADGEFVYAVKTTWVYCRPSCAARRARWENVVFLGACEEAERAGFRACKRCQPDGLALAEEYAVKVAAACRAIESSEVAPSLAVLAKAAGMSRFHFHRVFTKLTGLTPKAYALAHRAERMRRELPKRHSVTEAIYRAGFNSNGRFYAESARMLGMQPGKYRQGGSGEVIRFAVGKCSLGSILVAASAKGVCAISLGDDARSLEEDLRASFPKAELVGGDKKFERTVAKVVRLVEAPGIGLSLPLDVRGTAFQRRVWQALTKIPAGDTATYSEIARRIGAPKAIRAVAGACAANAIAVAIPCHRVVRTGGALAGYRWGIQRKKALLVREHRNF